MVDRNISASCVAAWALWALTAVLCMAAWVAGNIDIGRLSIITCGAAVTATIRTYFVTLGHRIQAALTVTATVSEGGSVRRMH